jgi:2',3'-cyclic-nucleotide 2'-phosphodiesterase (5'-nucleotidase family)
MKTLKSKHCGSGVTKCVFPGDFLGGSLFAVSHQGESMLRVCNEVGFDYVTLGNHEFDYGSTTLEGLISASNFKWLGSNVRYSKTKNIFHSILDYDSFLILSDDPDIFIRIGVFGLCTDETPTLSSPSDEVIFEDPLLHAKRIVKILKNQEKCDVIIALTHVSLEQDKLIAEIGGIDAILGGHDHEPYILEHREVLVMKCGQNLEYLGILDFDIQCLIHRDTSGSVNRSVTVHHSLQLVSTYDTPTDDRVNEMIQKWKNMAISSNNTGNDDMNEVLTIVDPSTPMYLSTKTSDCRRVETAFACILADAYKWYCEQNNHPCDFAIQNGGFIRGDTIYPAGASITRAVIKGTSDYDYDYDVENCKMK